MKYVLKAKKSNYLLAAVLTFFAGLVFASAQIPLPSNSSSLLWYTAEGHDDLAQLMQKAIASAKSSIYLSAFTLSDPHLLRLLKKKLDLGLRVEVICDSRYSDASLPSFVQRKKGVGLLHRKVLIIDEAKVFIGSANFTSSALSDQANHIAAFQSPRLAAFLKGGQGVFTEGDLTLYTLPSRPALEHLIQAIQEAKTSIDLALFTLSHPKLLEALEAAEGRGVAVRAIFDASGAHRSKRLSKRWVWRGKSLMHHKFALFDKKTIAFGSANWTKSAFEKNDDLIAFMPAPPKAKDLFERLLQKSLPNP